MSFSSDVKEELVDCISPGRHCRIAELSAIISLCGQVKKTKCNRYILKIHTENYIVARKCFTLIQKTFNINTDIIIRNNPGNVNKIYNLIITDYDGILRILQATKLINLDFELEEDLSITCNQVVKKTCCKRSFIRGTFLVTGSISNPEKEYHFEIVVSSSKKAEQLQELISAFDLEAKIIMRKKNYVVYLKESSQIVDILNVMEAHVSLMKLENIRIYKDMRNSVNRQVNCEAANIGKTVKAATKQIEDIKLIRDNNCFNILSEGLYDVALFS